MTIKSMIQTTIFRLKYKDFENTGHFCELQYNADTLQWETWNTLTYKTEVMDRMTVMFHFWLLNNGVPTVNQPGALLVNR